MKKLYVGNLPYETTEDELRNEFAAYGTINSVYIPERKGFAFIEIADDAMADKAIEEKSGQDFGGRPLTVNEARPKTDRPAGGGFGGGSRGGYQGGNGGGASRGGYQGGGSRY